MLSWFGEIQGHIYKGVLNDTEQLLGGKENENRYGG